MDKGKQLLQSLPHSMPQDKGQQVDCFGVDMDCGNQLSLVIYDEYTSKHKSSLVLEKKSP